MKLYYVAGAFSADDRAGVEENIRKAESMGLWLAEHGCAPIVPHSNTSHPNYEKLHDYEFWIAATTEMLIRCDALVLAGYWEKSKGTLREIAVARAHGIPVFFETGNELIASIKRWEDAAEVAE